MNIREIVSLPHDIVSTVAAQLIHLEEFLFFVLIDFSDTTPWVDIYMQHPKLQICPATLEVILETNPHLLQ